MLLSVVVDDLPFTNVIWESDNLEFGIGSACSLETDGFNDANEQRIVARDVEDAPATGGVGFRSLNV